MLFGRITDYTVRMGIRAPLLGSGHGDAVSPLYHTVSPGKNSGNTPGATPSGPTNLSAGGVGANGANSPSPGHTRTNSAAAGTTDPRNAPGFQNLDRLVAVEFLNSFPPRFRSCLGTLDASSSAMGVGFDGFTIPTTGGGLDTDLYVAHLVPHA